MELKSMFIYPVKSLGGIEVSEAKMQTRGLEYDRRWMLLDANGKFLTQRNAPSMALIQPEIDGQFLIIKKEGFEPLEIPLAESAYTPAQKVMVWKDETEALLAGHETNEWFSEVLKTKCSLVRMPSHAIRKSTDPSKPPQKQVSFADSQPILIANEASLDELNSRLKSPIPMNRFRANFVVKAPVAWEEDHWSGFSIGSVNFTVTKACGRCQVITIDQNTGEKDKEPFTVLSSYRRVEKRVNFGMRAKLSNNDADGKIIRVGERFTFFRS